jgi:hypothetical protein
MKKLIENWRRYSEQDETPGLDKALAHSTVAKDLKLMNTRPELSDVIRKVISSIKAQLPSLSDGTVTQAVKDVLAAMKDIGDDVSNLASDVADDVESTFKDVTKEVHVIDGPDDDPEEEDSNTGENR